MGSALALSSRPDKKIVAAKNAAEHRMEPSRHPGRRFTILKANNRSLATFERQGGEALCTSIQRRKTARCFCANAQCQIILLIFHWRPLSLFPMFFPPYGC
jgi:hypothetical protein